MNPIKLQKTTATIVVKRRVTLACQRCLMGSRTRRSWSARDCGEVTRERLVVPGSRHSEESDSSKRLPGIKVPCRKVRYPVYVPGSSPRSRREHSIPDRQAGADELFAGPLRYVQPGGTISVLFRHACTRVRGGLAVVLAGFGNAVAFLEVGPWIAYRLRRSCRAQHADRESGRTAHRRNISGNPTRGCLIAHNSPHRRRARRSARRRPLSQTSSGSDRKLHKYAAIGRFHRAFRSGVDADPD